MLILLMSHSDVRFIFFPYLFNHIVLFKVFEPVAVVHKKNKQCIFSTMQFPPFHKFR